jgi:hypothetical protein
VNRAGALGLELDDDASLESLEKASETLEAKLGECTEPSDLARLGTAIATIHAALHRIRHEARKRSDGANLSDDDAATQMLAWLQARGKLPS